MKITRANESGGLFTYDLTLQIDVKNDRLIPPEVSAQIDVQYNLLCERVSALFETWENEEIDSTR